METRSYNVYKFSELSKEAKEYAIAKYYENEEYPFLEEDILSELSQLDTLKIFSDIKLRYSLNYCQGDGLSFSANIDVDEYLKNKDLSQDNKQLISMEVYKMYSTGNKGRYSYAHRDQIEWEANGSDVRETTEKLIETIKKEIAEYYMEICKKLEKYGYSVLEYRMDDEEFEEHCKSNGYMFLENGKID